MKIYNRNLFFIVAIFLVSNYSTIVLAQNISGQEIMQKVIDRPIAKSIKSTIQLELINKRGKKRKRTLVSYSLDMGAVKKNLFLFTSPVLIKGTGFLTWEYEIPGKEDERWLYLPAIRKTRKVSGASAGNDYFMGTDFTFDDLRVNNIDEDVHTLLKEETFESKSCWVVESRPKNPEAMYSKKVSWIRKDNLLASKILFYDNKGILLKTLTISDVREIDGYWTVFKMHMNNHKNNHQTVYQISDIDYNIELHENQFTISNLKKKT